VGQDHAVELVADAIRRGRAGLTEGHHPIGSFIFLGPTGVGKTELARTLAEFLFDDEEAMVRIDMSEYQERHSVARLIGAPPGYVGYEEGGQLTEVVRRRPYAVVLFDEIEKAHPDVFNVMLQLLDDGRLTDSKGRTVDFSNTVVIMTSNVGGAALERLAVADPARAENEVREELRHTFRPEFLNRIDEVVMFNPLKPEHMQRIIDIQARRLDAILADRGLKVRIEDSMREYLAREGYDPVYGARPLKRLVNRKIQSPLARYILEGEPARGVLITVGYDANSDSAVFRAGE
jgi:ATP-dependent Clp protease ATP-binding subunit ClpB